MRYVVTAEEMRRYDTNTIEQIGIPGMVLMERAALAVRDRILSVCDVKGSVLIMAGVGNNGGDGLALARLLVEDGFKVEIWCVGAVEKATKQWRMQRKILESYDVIWSDEPTDLEYTISVDALFGVGLSKDVEGDYRFAIERFNSLRGYKIALDVPSGICSDTGRLLGCAVEADETVTFAYDKRGLYLYPGCIYTGKLQVADIGINERGFLGCRPQMFCLDEVSDWLPERKQDGNKGTFGKVLLVAGSAGMAGAAVLCAKAAYRVGAGMVKVLTHESNRVIVQESVPEAMYGTYDNLEESLLWADVVVVGPGLGKSEEACEVLRSVIVNCSKPLLIDADGLNLLAADKMLFELLSRQENRPVIVTPHVGEMSRLTKVSVEELKAKLWDYGRELANSIRGVVVAKDARSFVCCEGQPVCMNIYGNSGMATAGSGDVLAGIIAGLWAQYERADLTDSHAVAFRAACAGVRLHAAAGDAVAARKGEYACMAGDIAEAIADVMDTACI